MSEKMLFHPNEVAEKHRGFSFRNQLQKGAYVLRKAQIEVYVSGLMLAGPLSKVLPQDPGPTPLPSDSDLIIKGILEGGGAIILTCLVGGVVVLGGGGLVWALLRRMSNSEPVVMNRSSELKNRIGQQNESKSKPRGEGASLGTGASADGIMQSLSGGDSGKGRFN